MVLHSSASSTDIKEKECYTSTPCLHLHELAYSEGMVPMTLVSLSHQYCTYSTGNIVGHRRYAYLRKSISPLSVIKDSKVDQAHSLHRPDPPYFFYDQITRDKETYSLKLLNILRATVSLSYSDMQYYNSSHS